MVSIQSFRKRANSLGKKIVNVELGGIFIKEIVIIVCESNIICRGTIPLTKWSRYAE